MPFAYSQSFTASPTGRSSATLVALGLNTTITPVSSGRILVIASGVVATDTTTDGAAYNIYFNSGAIPANNDAVSGTALFASDITVTSLVTNNLAVPFCVAGIIGASAPLVAQRTDLKGATLAGTTYWVDIMFKRVTGGTVTFTGVNLSLVEL